MIYSLVADLSLFDEKFLGGVTFYELILFKQISRTVLRAKMPLSLWYTRSRQLVPDSGPSLPWQETAPTTEALLKLITCFWSVSCWGQSSNSAQVDSYYQPPEGSINIVNREKLSSTSESGDSSMYEIDEIQSVETVRSVWQKQFVLSNIEVMVRLRRSKCAKLKYFFLDL